jgi:cation diffusion facilitator CzcD-associated flavoprotein CzcO
MTQDLAPAIPLPPLHRVAVVGAGGPSGLVAVAQLLAAGVEPANILAFESRDRAGGVWNYEADPGAQHIAWRRAGPPVVRSDAELAAHGANGPSGEYTHREGSRSHVRPPAH